MYEHVLEKKNYKIFHFKLKSFESQTPLIFAYIHEYIHRVREQYTNTRIGLLTLYYVMVVFAWIYSRKKVLLDQEHIQYVFWDFSNRNLFVLKLIIVFLKKEGF